MWSVTKLARPVGSALYGLRALNHLIGQQLNDALMPLDLTLAQMGILMELRRRPGVSSAALARSRSLTPQTMSEIITGLEKERLLERRPHGGRILRVYLTPAGSARLASAGGAAADIERRVLAGLSAKEQDRLRELIFKCVDQLTLEPQQRAG